MTKKLVPGRTLYLNDDEDFNIIETVQKIDAEILAEAPQGIVINSKGERIAPQKMEAPIEEVASDVVEEQIQQLEEVIKQEPEEEVKEDAKRTITLAKKMLEQDESKDDYIELITDESIEREVKIDLYEDLETTDMAEEIMKEEPKASKRKAKVIDIDGLHIVNKTEMDKEKDLRNALFGNKAAYQIIAAQSGYTAKVLPLVHKDILNILNEKANRFERQKSLYRVIWEKIHDTSIGKMSFEQWLRHTSVEDLETFYYGVYASTFPDSGSFRFKCPSCGKEHDYKVYNDNLVKTTDRPKMKKLIELISRESISMDTMQKLSLIGKNQGIQLTDSGLVFELRTPSLLDLLEILRTVPEKTIDRDAESIVYMLYVNQVGVPTLDKTGYFMENKKPNILRIIDNLGIDDANEFKDAVDARIDENRITYSLKNIKCVECQTEIKDVPLSIENILFTLIFEKAQ